MASISPMAPIVVNIISCFLQDFKPMNQLVDMPTGDPFSREWFRLQKQDKPHSFFFSPPPFSL
jgi:hypothetical protein